ncbi:MAG: peptidylprolyl isomerase [Flavobacteriaceae bacterium]
MLRNETSLDGLGRAFALSLFLAASPLAMSAALAQDQNAQDQNAAQATEAAPIDPARVVASVDGKEITEADVDAALEDLGDSVSQVPEERRRQYAATYLVDLELMSKAAREAGVDKDPDFTRRTRFLENKVLLEIHLNRIGEKATTDEAAQKLYDRLVAEMPKEKEVRARHILVKTEDEAKEIAKQLADGGDFEAIAKEKSIDPGSGPDGGDLGFFTKDRMVPEFAEAAFAMEPGAVSEPVETQFGWHIIKVEEVREKQPPAFADVKGQLLELVAQEAQRDAVLAARSAAKIERFDGAAPADSEGGNSGQQ